MFFKGRRLRRSARASKTRRSPSKTNKIILESLEPRLLLSTITVTDGVLTATLDDTPEAVQIQQTDVASDGGVVLTLSINGGAATSYGDASVGIKSVSMLGKGGDDTFTFGTPVDIPVEIDGGA